MGSWLWKIVQSTQQMGQEHKFDSKLDTKPLTIALQHPEQYTLVINNYINEQSYCKSHI